MFCKCLTIQLAGESERLIIEFQRERRELKRLLIQMESASQEDVTTSSDKTAVAEIKNKLSVREDSVELSLIDSLELVDEMKKNLSSLLVTMRDMCTAERYSGNRPILTQTKSGDGGSNSNTNTVQLLSNMLRDIDC